MFSVSIEAISALGDVSRGEMMEENLVQFTWKLAVQLANSPSWVCYMVWYNCASTRTGQRYDRWLMAIDRTPLLGGGAAQGLGLSRDHQRWGYEGASIVPRVIFCLRHCPAILSVPMWARLWVLSLSYGAIKSWRLFSQNFPQETPRFQSGSGNHEVAVSN